MFEQVGVTVDGKPVVSGIFKMFETHGIPLDVLIGIVSDRGFVPCWRSFYKDARAAGMKHDRILSKLSEALSDAHGAVYRDEVLKRLIAS